MHRQSAVAPVGRFPAPLIKKCAILAISPAIDQRYTENYDECCAMLRAVTEYVRYHPAQGHALHIGDSKHQHVLQRTPRFQEL